MKITQRTASGVTVLDVEGPITIESQQESLLRETVRSLLAHGRLHVLLNLDSVSDVDSAGLGDIVQAYMTLKRAGGSLKLEHLKPHVHKLLAVTMLLTVIDTFESEADALASFAGSP
jgi:anti-sigma B factor antagonist